MHSRHRQGQREGLPADRCQLFALHPQPARAICVLLANSPVLVGVVSVHAYQQVTVLLGGPSS